MSGLLLCGKTAQIPLYVQDIDKNIYSIEELCYYLYNNIYMVGPDFFNQNLVDFIEKGIGLEKTASILKKQISQNDSYVNMIHTIFDGSDYYDESEKKEIQKILEELSGKSLAERVKKRGDLLMEIGKYSGALKTYKQLFGKNYQITDEKLLGSIWNNMGVIYAKMFLFNDAVSCFRLAWDMYRQQEFMDNLICSAIFADRELSEPKYADEIKKEYQISQEDFDRYEKAIQLAQEDAENSRDVKSCVDKTGYSTEKELSQYYRDVDAVLDKWKNEYREQMQ